MFLSTFPCGREASTDNDSTMSIDVSLIRFLTVDDHSLFAKGLASGEISKVRALRTVVLIVLAYLFGCVLGAAQGFERTIGQFQHTAWGSKEGEPGQIRALAQTTDGYLWLGTTDGLYRFDGVSFERYDPRTSGSFPGRSVSCLLALPNGDLWIGFWPSAISLLRDGHVTNYTARDGVPAGRLMGFAQDREGTIWAASLSGPMRLEGNVWKNVGKEWNFPGTLALTIFVDRHGTLWLATEDTLVFLPPGAKQFQPTGVNVAEVSQIAEAVNGKLWMAETTRSVRPVPLGSNLPPSDEAEIRVGSVGILFDREGALWMTTLGDGVRRAPHPERLSGTPGRSSSAVESFTAKDGLTDDYAIPILQDREGNIWLGSHNGLDRFRKSTLVSVPLPGPPRELDLAAGDGGDLWVRGTNLWVRVHGTRTDVIRGRLGGNAKTTYRDPGGTIWWVEASTLRRFEDNRVTDIPMPEELRDRPWGFSVTGDRLGGLWMAVEGKGLYYIKRGVWKRFKTPPDIVKLRPMAAFTDWMGRIWFGYSTGTIIRIDNEKIKIISSEGYSPVGGVRAIQGHVGHIWFGGVQGLAFFDGTGFRPVVPMDAATFGPVSGIVEISDGSLWLSESRGVVHIAAHEVMKFLGDSSYRVQYELFDSFDGLPGTFHDANAAEVQGTDGRLWFAASDGIAWLDPANIAKNVLPPPVSIRSLTADGKQYPYWMSAVLPPLTRNLQIQFTALSLSIPERVRFRYKLEGFDKDWQDGGTRREAFYTNLGPAKYRFHVIACNNDGVWNETGAMLDFRVSPAWYQTIWFRSSYVVVFALFLWALHQLRLRQLARQLNMRLEERVGERTRIARELHDTLLQNLHGLMFQFQAARNMVHKRPDEAIQTLDSAIIETEEAIAESQDAIRDLRSEQMAQNDLAQLLTAMANELANSQDANHNAPSVRVIVEGEQRILLPVLQDEIYRIARETLRNAFQHAKAHQIEAEIRYEVHSFRLRIRDDGKGIEPEVLKEGKRAGHWGLPGVRERAQRIGAKLDVWSEAGAGTEVQLTVPAALAYETSRDRPRFRLFRGAKS
jgi:signal transduction histidine kinase/ligand-binding sensor domain-containing protein